MGENDQDIGGLKAEVRILNHLVEEVRSDLKKMREEFAQVRGGWKVLLILSGAAGAVVAWVSNYFLGKH